jgi:hypothetical protein
MIKYVAFVHIHRCQHREDKDVIESKEGRGRDMTIQVIKLNGWGKI